jgi:hypothetical protein
VVSPPVHALFELGTEFSRFQNSNPVRFYQFTKNPAETGGFCQFRPDFLQKIDVVQCNINDADGHARHA